MEMYTSSTLNLVALLVFFSFLFTILFHKWRKSKMPPGPWRLPLIGSIHHMRGALPHHTLTNLAKRYGPIMYLQLGQVPMVVISSPRIAKQVLHDVACASRPQITASTIISYNCNDIAFAQFSEYLKGMRKICVMELLSTKMVKSFSSIRKDELSCLVSSIRSMNGSVFNVTQKILWFTSSMVYRSSCGKVYKERDELIKLTGEVLELISGFDAGDLFPSSRLIGKMSGKESRAVKVHRRVDAALKNIVNEHIKNRALGSKGNGEFGGEDLVDVFLRIKEIGELPFPITNEHVKAVILDIFTGGTETSGLTIIWALCELMKNPRIMAKAQSEVREAFKGKTAFDEDCVVDKLSYLNSVIKETLRLHPPVPLVPRACREQTYIDGYTIPAKATILVNTWGLGRDPEIWNEAESFIPERFEDSAIDCMGNHFEFLPFGSGKRICPGIQFGLANVRHPLAWLLYHFNWALPDGTGPEDLDMTEKGGLSAAKEKDLYLIAIDHKDADGES